MAGICAAKIKIKPNGFDETELITDHVFYRKQKVTKTVLCAAQPSWALVAEGWAKEPLVLY